MVQNKLKPQINQMNTEFLIKTSHWRAGLNDFSDYFLIILIRLIIVF